MKVTNEMRERWEDMGYHEQWHDPAYRLYRVTRAYEKATKDGSWFVHGSCKCDSGDCDYCLNTNEFGVHPCELCGSMLAGARYDLVLLTQDDHYHYQVCGDCYYYHQYGQLDDQTMLELDDLYPEGGPNVSQA